MNDRRADDFSVWTDLMLVCAAVVFALWCIGLVRNWL